MYEVGEIFTDDEEYSKRAEWCNNNGCYIEEITQPDDVVRYFQIKEIWDNRDNLDIAEYEGPTAEEQELQETEQEMSETASRISEIKDTLLTAVLLDDTKAQEELKAEYKALTEGK